MTASLTIRYADGQSITIPLKEVIELALGPMATTQLAFNRKKNGDWAMIINRSLLLGRQLADEFLTARKDKP